MDWEHIINSSVNYVERRFFSKASFPLKDLEELNLFTKHFHMQGHVVEVFKRYGDFELIDASSFEYSKFRH